MKSKHVLSGAGALVLIAWLNGCGGNPGGPEALPPPPPQTPAATITGNGQGNLVLHPSLDNRFTYALETPIRITETGGGTANWNFARIQIVRSGNEIERYELGSDVIATAGYKLIAARSDKVYTIVFRQNSDNFDRVDITLGFSDLKDGRQFPASVPFNSFADVNISLTPMFVPPTGTVHSGGR